jgi:hypothetical protein
MYKTFKDFIKEKETPPHYNEGIYDTIRGVAPGLTSVAKTAAIDATKIAKNAISNSGSYFAQAYAKGNAARRVSDMKKYINYIVENPEFKSLRPDVQKAIISIQRYFTNNHK